MLQARWDITVTMHACQVAGGGFKSNCFPAVLVIICNGYPVAKWLQHLTFESHQVVSWEVPGKASLQSLCFHFYGRGLQ